LNSFRGNYSRKYGKLNFCCGNYSSEETIKSYFVLFQWVDIVAQSLKAEKGDNNNTKLTGVLIANKTDLEDRRIISPKVGTELAQQLGLLYFECSAKDFKDVENPFYYLANEWHKIYTETADKLIES
jgi:GTPase SAR1 family protein